MFDLKEEDIVTVLGQKTTNQIQQACNNSGFIPIPPGDSKPKANTSQGVLLEECRFASGVIPQNTSSPCFWKQLNGQRSCMPLAISNAFYYVEDNTIGNQFYNAVKSLTGNLDIWKKVADMIAASKHWRVTRKFPGFPAFRNFPNMDVDLEGILILGLQSSDGKQDHVICVVKNKIIDSNQDGPIDLTREKLDECCSSEYAVAKFVRVWKYLYATQK